MTGQDKILAGLNPPQLEAVTFGDGPLLVLAGAGSGKTRVLTSRVAHLIATGRAAPEQVLAVTFTNKAAGEMKARIERLTDMNKSRMQVSTFHSFAALLLRFYGERLGLPNGYTIYDQDDALSAIKSCLTELKIDSKKLTAASVLDRISDAKTEMVGVDAFAATAYSPDYKKVAQVYELYERKLKAAGALDFDDLLVDAVKLLQKDVEIRTRLQQKYRYLLIDEYQDTNKPQYLMAKILSEANHNIFAVGDEDQSIYGWRGANIQNILNFEHDFPNCKIIRLEQNYRSTQTILKAASTVVSNNRMRKGKTLFSVGEKGEPLVLMITENDDDEAERLAARIEDQIRANVPRSEIALLYRTNAQSRALEESLKRRFIPYKIVGGIRFYQRKEIKDMLAYLKLIENPKDDVSFRRVINYPKRGIGDATLSQLEAKANELGCSLLELISRSGQLDFLTAGAGAKLAKFAKLLDYLTKMAATLPLGQLMQLVADKTGITADLKALDPTESEMRLENVEELIASGVEYALENVEAGVATFLQDISLYTDLDNYDRQSDAVTLMTLHGAKGLEFESVFITGLEDGLFPISRSLDDTAKLEEERRLFYVGMTRAKSRLTLSYALHRARFGNKQTLRSRFLDEVPDEVLDTVRYTLVDARGNVNSSFVLPEYHDDDDPYAFLRIGTAVYHPRWGEGAVTNRNGSGDNTEVEVRFHFAGTKKLVARYAKLRPLR
jgi:DNA helicase II / ATP-dependent DNA helicase PcrA